jgi:hypothetical protein
LKVKENNRAYEEYVIFLVKRCQTKWLTAGKASAAAGTAKVSKRRRVKGTEKL